MDMEAYKQKAIVLLGEYHKREAQVKLLKIECQALEQLAPGVSAVSYDQMAAHTNKVASMVEGEVQRIEQLPEQLPLDVLHHHFTGVGHIIHKIRFVLAGLFPRLLGNQLKLHLHLQMLNEYCITCISAQRACCFKERNDV